MLTKNEFGDFTNPEMLKMPERSNEVCQSFVFEEGNLGPCWMTEAEQELNKYNHKLKARQRRSS
jgi:hypothetical protein